MTVQDDVTGRKPQSQAFSGRIEGGLDAIVVGATIDGYAAAGILAKSGFRTVLLEGQPGGDMASERDVAPGFRYVPGDKAITHIDPALIDYLDLYKHGLRYAQRRLKTTYHYDEQESLTNLGEISDYKAMDDVISEIDAQKLLDFTQRISGAARRLRPTFYNGEFPENLEPEIDRIVTASTETILSGAFDDARISAAFRGESQFGKAANAEDSQTFLALVYKLSGEVSGRQGARGYLEGGVDGLKMSLRRACQTFDVGFRGIGKVNKLLVEWDHAAGVELEDGSQLRAPVVVTTAAAKTAFTEHIGHGRLSVELEQALRPTCANVASLGFAVALTGIDDVPSDDSEWKERRHFRVLREHVYPIALRKARLSSVADDLAMELVFPSVWSGAEAPVGGAMAQGRIFPVPNDPEFLKDNREKLEAAVEKAIAVISPSLKVEVIDFADFSQIEVAGETVLQAWRRAQTFFGSPIVDGYFFAGREARLGETADGSVGRRAGRAAEIFLRNRHS